MTTAVPLPRGMFALVDDEDADRVLAMGSWSVREDRRTHYASTHVMSGGARVYLLMHRLILDAPPGRQVDHRDGNGLNNTRANLRLATASENARNRRPRRGSASGVKGVTWHPGSRMWQARIRAEGRTRSLGYFATPAEAGVAYDAAAREAFGEFARINTP